MKLTFGIIFFRRSAPAGSTDSVAVGPRHGLYRSLSPYTDRIRQASRLLARVGARARLDADCPIRVLRGLYRRGRLGGPDCGGALPVRRWARYSVLIIGGILAVFSLMSFLLTLAMLLAPLPGAAGMDPSQAHNVHAFTKIFFGVIALFHLVRCAIGVSWLVYFIRRECATSLQACRAKLRRASPAPDLHSCRIHSDRGSQLPASGFYSLSRSFFRIDSARMGESSLLSGLCCRASGRWNRPVANGGSGRGGWHWLYRQLERLMCCLFRAPLADAALHLRGKPNDESHPTTSRSYRFNT